MLFAQFTGRDSLGMQPIKRSTLSDANRDRPVAIFTETFFYLLEKIRGPLGKKDHSEMVRLIDSSTIDLNLKQFAWADFRSTKAGVKIHTVYDPHAKVPVFFEISHAKVNDRKILEHLPVLPEMTYVLDRAYNDYGWYYMLCQQNTRFVGRMKSNAQYEIIEEKAVNQPNLLHDQVIKLSGLAGKKCPQNLRRITIIREKDGKELTFISNDLKCEAQEIAALYKSRWQIELFFKWIKKNLKIKRFVGRSENAVKIQILVAMVIYYCDWLKLEVRARDPYKGLPSLSV